MVSLTIRDAPEKAPKNRKKTHHPLGGIPLKFVCIDGEGFTDPDGIHRYKLLGIGEDQISNTRGLEFTEILEFLYSHYEKGTVFGGFFLGYDFTQALKSLPEERARMLLTDEGRAKRARKVKGNHAIAPHPVEYAGWQFDMLGNKRLRIRPKKCECPIQSCPCKPKPPWMYVCDTGGFFQSAFLSVIDPAKWSEPIVTADEYQTILEGKARRSDAVLDAEAARYNRLENIVLSRVLGEYNKGLEAIDVRLTPSKWFGPGQAAQEWMRRRAPRRVDLEKVVPLWFLEACMASYFGGWFEIMMHGIIPGESHEYDINSAYPHIIRNLPCMLHATYERGTGPPPMDGSNEYTLVRTRVWTQSYGYRHHKHYVGAMLHRDPNGRICRPSITEGWYWLDELEAARKAKCITRVAKDRYYEWMRMVPGQCPPDCHPRPMREVESLYLRRLAVGKDTPFGKAAKNTYNSMYGKFAQSVGQPIYGNPFYASRITSGCRKQILEAIASHPKGKSNVAMVATDAVFFLSPHPTLECSEDLGQWGHQSRHNLTLFKPGVYWDDKTREQIARGENPTFKARGVNASAFASELEGIDNQFREWSKNGPPSDPTNPWGSRGWPMVEYSPSFSMTSAVQALLRNDWSLCGHVTVGQKVKQSSVPYDKRTVDLWYDEEYGVYRSEPKWFAEGSGERWYLNERPPRAEIECASTPYDKRFGLDDPFSEESRSAMGITPDGYVGDEFRDILLGRV